MKMPANVATKNKNEQSVKKKRLSTVFRKGENKENDLDDLLEMNDDEVNRHILLDFANKKKAEKRERRKSRMIEIDNTSDQDVSGEDSPPIKVVISKNLKKTLISF